MSETQTEQEYGIFTQSQEELTEEINLRLFDKPRCDRIKEKILEDLK